MRNFKILLVILASTFAISLSAQIDIDGTGTNDLPVLDDGSGGDGGGGGGEQPTETNFADCDNYNQFLRIPASVEFIYNYADEIMPNGAIIFDPNKTFEFNGIIDLYPALGLNSDYTFVQTGIYESPLNNEKVTVRYQQYFKGVKVTGGGYSRRIPKTSGPDGPNGPEGPGPCDQFGTLTPYLATNIDIDPNPHLTAEDAHNVIANQLGVGIDALEIFSSDVIIFPNISNNCAYKLVYEVTYAHNGSQISYIDAHLGEILKTIEGDMNINAPTITYGTQNLNDRNDGSMTHLESPDGTIRIFDECNFTISSAWNNGSIPQTSSTNSSWTTEASLHAYQNFYVTSEVVNLYRTNLGIPFGQVNVSVCPTYQNARSLRGSTVQMAFIIVGANNGAPYSLFDVVGHELGHTYLNTYLDYTLSGNQSLHEGISDILGTYAEYLHQGNADWILGDDEPIIAGSVGRNFALPICLYSVYNDEPHARGLPIGHLYYLVSQGDQALGIPALGMKKPIDILISGLHDVSRTADYPELMKACLNSIIEEYGRCSVEFLAFARAFEKICVVTGHAVNGIVPPCPYVLTGPALVCEESNHAQFWLNTSNGAPLSISIPNITWQIIGQNNTGFQSTKGMQGNAQHGGSTFDIVKFPDYPYYPQYVKINVTFDSPYGVISLSKRLKIIDCDQDDPTCEEYYGLGIGSPPGDTKMLQVSSDNPITNYRIYDCTGRLIQSGKISDLDITRFKNQIYILQKLDKTGAIVSSKKIFTLE
jgi:hypothetical protein